jgi:predicted membrane-bound mannosyltransferase
LQSSWPGGWHLTCSVIIFCCMLIIFATNKNYETTTTARTNTVLPLLLCNNNLYTAGCFVNHWWCMCILFSDSCWFYSCQRNQTIKMMKQEYEQELRWHVLLCEISCAAAW